MTTRRTVLEPAQVRRLEPAASADVWVYRYDHVESGWRLSIATHAAPGSGKLSLGGFRIAPESRTARADYDNDREAIGLAVGMEEKVYWSRVLRVGGPLVQRNLDRIVGGKCVLRPTADARIGQPNDRALLDWAVSCLRDCDATAGIHVTTGQDLGHGTMSDGATPSLAYLHARFEGSMLADTSKPTGEGNVQLLLGMLEACGIAVADARVGLVGAGNIGQHMVGRLREHGTTPAALELSERTRAMLAGEGVSVWPIERKAEFLAQPFDAIVVNAAGSTLDAPSIAAIAANPAVRIVCGSENLAMPDPAGERTLLAARKVYAHTELGGMMGYLTAAEEYLARRAGVPFDVGTLFAAAERLREIGRAATARVIAGGYQETFQEAAKAIAG
ncbi:MAG: hypothetical protein ACXWZS_03380 [Gemmatirosa sp.]